MSRVSIMTDDRKAGIALIVGSLGGILTMAIHPTGTASLSADQIAHLAIARHWNSKYPWFAQVRRSLSVGIDQAAIDAINARKTPRLDDARERTCFVVASEILANKGLSDASYAAAEKTMGLESLVALVALTGSFSMTCMTAATFGIDPPPENPIPLA